MQVGSFLTCTSDKRWWTRNSSKGGKVVGGAHWQARIASKYRYSALRRTTATTTMYPKTVARNIVPRQVGILKARRHARCYERGCGGVGRSRDSQGEPGSHLHAVFRRKLGSTYLPLATYPGVK